MRTLLALAFLFVATAAHAGIDNPPLTISQVQAVMPQPASSVPPTETVPGAIGTPGTYRPADAVQPRITRATTVVTAVGGTFSGTWASPLALPPQIILTPVTALSASVSCQLTATPTATDFQGKCWTSQSTTLNLSIITAGLNLNPFAATASGITVQVIALPPTQ